MGRVRASAPRVCGSTGSTVVHVSTSLAEGSGLRGLAPLAGSQERV